MDYYWDGSRTPQKGKINLFRLIGSPPKLYDDRDVQTGKQCPLPGTPQMSQFEVKGGAMNVITGATRKYHGIKVLTVTAKG